MADIIQNTLNRLRAIAALLPSFVNHQPPQAVVVLGNRRIILSGQIAIANQSKADQCYTVIKRERHRHAAGFAGRKGFQNALDIRRNIIRLRALHPQPRDIPHILSVNFLQLNHVIFLLLLNP